MRLRHAQMRVAAEQALQAALVLDLGLVVELVGDPVADLVQHRRRIEVRCEAREDGTNEPEVAQIGLGRLRHPRMLHLDGDELAVARARLVDLAQRRERERLLVDVVEQPADLLVEILLDDASHLAERDRRGAVGKRPEGRGRLAIELDHRQELFDLRPGAAQPSELRPECLCQRLYASAMASAAASCSSRERGRSPAVGHARVSAGRTSVASRRAALSRSSAPSRTSTVARSGCQRNDARQPNVSAGSATSRIPGRRARGDAGEHANGVALDAVDRGRVTRHGELVGGVGQSDHGEVAAWEDDDQATGVRCPPGMQPGRLGPRPADIPTHRVAGLNVVGPRAQRRIEPRGEHGLQPA